LKRDVRHKYAKDKEKPNRQQIHLLHRTTVCKVRQDYRGRDIFQQQSLPVFADSGPLLAESCKIDVLYISRDDRSFG